METWDSKDDTKLERMLLDMAQMATGLSNVIRNLLAFCTGIYSNAGYEERGMPETAESSQQAADPWWASEGHKSVRLEPQWTTFSNEGDFKMSSRHIDLGKLFVVLDPSATVSWHWYDSAGNVLAIRRLALLWFVRSFSSWDDFESNCIRYGNPIRPGGQPPKIESRKSKVENRKSKIENGFFYAVLSHYYYSILKYIIQSLKEWKSWRVFSHERITIIYYNDYYFFFFVSISRFLFFEKILLREKRYSTCALLFYLCAIIILFDFKYLYSYYLYNSIIF